jgi:hypothetical protein
VGVRYRTFGSVEGKVERVSVQKGARWFDLRAQRTQRSVRCTLPEELEQPVLDAIKDRRRVIVTGLVAYNARHEPISVEVQRPLRLLGREDELPSSRDLASGYRHFKQKNGDQPQLLPAGLDPQAQQP